MTKKHFKALAAELKAIKPSTTNEAAIRQWQKCCIAVERVCKSSNPLFDHFKWLSALDYYVKDEAKNPDLVD